MNRLTMFCNTTIKTRSVLLAVLFLATPLALLCNAAAQAPARFVGSITAIGGRTLTVKPDSGEARQVEVPEAASIKRIAPGERDLSKAGVLPFEGLAVGDRVLVKLDLNAPAGAQQAAQIVAVKSEDVALKQQKEREDWQKRGVGGLVKSVDPSAGIIVVTSGSGSAAKSIAIHIARTTMLKRYAPASVSYEAAQPAPIDAIHAGDQLRARGEKSAGGTSVAAEEVISGSFRNISGVIASVDAAASTITLKDLATKKQVTLAILPDSQMHRLSDRMAQMIALRLKSASASAATPYSASDRGVPAGAGARAGASGQWGGSQGGGQPAGGGQWAANSPARASGQAGSGQWSGTQGANGQNGSTGSDPQQLLNRLPLIQISDLKKGDAIMAVSTDGADKVTTITLLAGVEPLLEAPAAQNLLANWSMGSGGGETGQ